MFSALFSDLGSGLLDCLDNKVVRWSKRVAGWVSGAGAGDSDEMVFIDPS